MIENNSFMYLADSRTRTPTTEGLPLGCRVSKVIRKESDWLAILVPDNVYNVTDLTEVPVPEGWRRISENWFRPIKEGDMYISRRADSHAVVEFNLQRDYDTRRIIVERAV